MSAFRLVAAALLAAAVAPPARAETPAICAEDTAALAMDLYSVAQARLDLCLALEGLSVEQRVRALDRKSAGLGKSVAVSDDPGGRRLLNKTKHQQCNI